MKQAAQICRFFMWTAMVLTTVVQATAVGAIMYHNAQAETAKQPEAIFSPVLMLAGMLMLIVGPILMVKCRKHSWIGVAVMAVGGVLLAFNNLRLAEHYSPNLVGTEEVGLTVSKLLWRHWSAELVPLFGIAAWILEALPQWRMAPEAILLPDSEAEKEEGERPKGSVFVQCSRCEAKFFNSRSESVFTCPYCRKKLKMPGENWEGRKKKRSVQAKERKKAANKQ